MNYATVTTPGDPGFTVKINIWGINFAGVIQQGNTALRREFARYPADPHIPSASL
ncbi:hypothetical protein [Bacillus cereus]|uniref:hypothetical protein n=1 Tax=Bacillus cereus TaxID=1396 RepID=UPI0015C30DDC|nr:hypothetical protein [Bacillus cereus]